MTVSPLPILPAAPEPAAPELPRLADAEPRPTGRVLHVINGEHFSGAERVQDLLGLRLPAHGFEVGFVALKAGRFGDVRQSTAAPLMELKMASRWDLRAAASVARVCRAGGYDLLHAHTPRSALIASIAARLTGAPLIYHVHSPTSRDSTHEVRNWVNDKVERWSIRSAARLITVSPTLSDDLESRGVDRGRMRCVLNGVPIMPGAEPRRRPTNGWTIGMVALFRPRKGAEVLLEALAELRERGHDVQLRMIGPFEDKYYEAELMRLADGLGVEDAVRWTGFTDNVAEQLDRVDLLALPSLFGEGLPMVVLEAMAMALPVVATRCEGVSQAVVDGETGRLVEPADARALASAIEWIITGADDYEQLSEASLRRHAEQFSDDAMAARVAEIYREVLSRS